MLLTGPPPSPPDMLTLTEACALSVPATVNLATRNCPPGISFQSAGTCQAGLPSVGPAAAAAGIGKELMSPIGGCEGGKSARDVLAAKLMDLRKAIKAGFCSVTNASSPFILKNQATPSRRRTAARIRLLSPEPGFSPA